MSPSVEVNRQPGSGDIWSKYADALHEIMRLQEELSSKDDQIKNLTVTIVQMKLELATAKATQDDLGMQLRRASIVDATVIENAMTEKKSEQRISRRASARQDSTRKHSNSIAVQNPSSQRKTRPVVPRHKSDSWASRASEIDKTHEDEKLDESLNGKQQLRSFRLGWGLESELDDSRTDSRSSESNVGTQEVKTKKDLPSHRGLGSFMRRISQGSNNPNTMDKTFPSPSKKIMVEQVPVKSDVDAFSLRRPTAKAREESMLKCSAVVFPVASSDLLSAFLEESGRIGKEQRRNFACNHLQSRNETWAPM